MICLEEHEFLGAIGFYYSDFRQTSDEEVIEAMARYSSDAMASASGLGGKGSAAVFLGYFNLNLRGIPMAEVVVSARSPKRRPLGARLRGEGADGFVERRAHGALNTHQQRSG